MESQNAGLSPFVNRAQGRDKEKAPQANLRGLLNTFNQPLSFDSADKRRAGREAHSDEGQRAGFRHDGRYADIGKIDRAAAIAILDKAQTEISFRGRIRIGGEHGERNGNCAREGLAAGQLSAIQLELVRRAIILRVEAKACVDKRADLQVSGRT